MEYVRCREGEEEKERVNKREKERERKDWRMEERGGVGESRPPVLVGPVCPEANGTDPKRAYRLPL